MSFNDVPNREYGCSINIGGWGLTLLQVAFIFLKVFKIIDWDWIWVLAPLWICIVIAVIIFGIIVWAWTKH